MRRSKFRHGRGAAACCAAAAAMLGSQIRQADALQPAADPIIRIEEDWQLVLNEPDVDCESPQFHTLMTPFANLDGLYFQTSWNYRELPDFSSGGLQLQVWNGEADFAARNVGDNQLSRDAETVTWTARMEADSSHVTFSIQNGHSSSWGDFGGESMTVRTRKPISSIASYDPAVSTGNSWITFGSNRVNSLVLTEVRYYSAEGLVQRDSTPRIVFRYSDSE